MICKKICRGYILDILDILQYAEHAKYVAICHTIYQIAYWSYKNRFFVIFGILFVIFCILSCIFCILKRTGQGQFLQCSTTQNLKALWVEALMCFCNPQKAGSGKIRAAAAWSSITGYQCWSSCTGRHCCRASVGTLLTNHVLLSSYPFWSLISLHHVSGFLNSCIIFANEDSFAQSSCKKELASRRKSMKAPGKRWFGFRLFKFKSVGALLPNCHQRKSTPFG